MTFFFERIIRLTTAGLLITEPRIHCTVEQKADQSQDKAEITVWNLSSGHEQQIYDRGGPITIEAGYPNLTGRIFDGHVTRTERVRENLARQTRISAGSRAILGPSALGGRTARGYSGDTLLGRIVYDLVIEDLGLNLGPMDLIPTTATVRRYTWSGPTDEALTALLARFGLSWYVDADTVRIRGALPGGASQSDAPTIRVTPDHGLIGAPRVSDRGVEFEMFLNPLIRRGSLVILESETVTTRDHAVALRHDIDNWQGRFVTQVDMRRPGEDDDDGESDDD